MSGGAQAFGSWLGRQLSGPQPDFTVQKQDPVQQSVYYDPTVMSGYQGPPEQFIQPGQDILSRAYATATTPYQPVVYTPDQIAQENNRLLGLNAGDEMQAAEYRYAGTPAWQQQLDWWGLSGQPKGLPRQFSQHWNSTPGVVKF